MLKDFQKEEYHMQNTTFDCISKGVQPKQLFDISKVSEQPELQSDDFDKLLKNIIIHEMLTI